MAPWYIYMSHLHSYSYKASPSRMWRLIGPLGIVLSVVGVAWGFFYFTFSWAGGL